MKFCEIERLKFDNRRTISVEALEDGTQYVDMSNEAERQYFYLLDDEALALHAWLTRALYGEVDLLKLLEVAKCPNCDGSGGVPHQVAPDEWEQEECQWCYERYMLLAAASEPARGTEGETP